MAKVQEIITSFVDGFNNDKETKKTDKEFKINKENLRHLNEKQIDKIIDDSFPASDPPSTY